MSSLPLPPFADSGSSDRCPSQGRPWPSVLSPLESWLPAPALATPPGSRRLFSRPPPPRAPWAPSLPSFAPLTPRGLVQAPDPDAVGSPRPQFPPLAWSPLQNPDSCSGHLERPLDTAAAGPASSGVRPPPACLGHALDNSPGTPSGPAGNPVGSTFKIQPGSGPRRPLSPCELCVNISAPLHSHFPCRFFLIRRVYNFLYHLLVPYMCFLFSLIPLKCKLDDVRGFCGLFTGLFMPLSVILCK